MSVWSVCFLFGYSGMFTLTSSERWEQRLIFPHSLAFKCNMIRESTDVVRVPTLFLTEQTQKQKTISISAHVDPYLYIYPYINRHRFHAWSNTILIQMWLLEGKCMCVYLFVHSTETPGPVLPWFMLTKNETICFEFLLSVVCFLERFLGWRISNVITTHHDICACVLNAYDTPTEYARQLT